jgi:hypothetical protein
MWGDVKGGRGIFRGELHSACTTGYSCRDVVDLQGTFSVCDRTGHSAVKTLGVHFGDRLWSFAAALRVRSGRERDSWHRWHQFNSR